MIVIFFIHTLSSLEDIQLRKALSDEIHFDRNSTKDMYVFHLVLLYIQFNALIGIFLFSLEPDVEQKFIQLLTIEFDANREKRVDGDTFCTMLEQILTKKRKITPTFQGRNTYVLPMLPPAGSETSSSQTIHRDTITCKNLWIFFVFCSLIYFAV